MVNILISTYNGEKYIGQQIDSILQQTYQDYHIFIRDDGSTDHTVEIVQKLLKERHLSNNVTFIKGRNVGFRLSFYDLLRKSPKGDFWAFCDQDDYWYPDKLANAIDWFQKQEDHEEIPMLYHGGVMIGDEDLYPIQKYHVNDFTYDFRTSFTSNIFFGFAMVINRPLYEKLIQVNFGKIKYHDWLAAMITTAFGRYHFAGQVDSIHRMHKNNTSAFYFWKKIPDGIRLLRGDNFYRSNTREFYRVFGNELSENQKRLCLMFMKTQKKPIVSFKKAFYPGRWNPKMSVELIQRILMLVGVI